MPRTGSRRRKRLACKGFGRPGAESGSALKLPQLSVDPGTMGNRASPQPPPPPPPKWQQVIAPPAREEREAPEPIGDRERAEWFARLPDHAKEEIRDRWRAQEGVRGHQVQRRKETSHRWVVEGAALFFLSVAILQMPSRLGLVLAAVIGGAIGRVAALVKPGPLVYGIVFSAACAIFAAFSGFRNLVCGIISIPIVFGLAAALGTTHRLQRFDSSEL